MTNTAKLCLIVPCYNEEKRLDINVFESFFKSNSQIDFLFVNDGSFDQTQSILNKWTDNFPNIKNLKLDKNVGKAEAVRQGSIVAHQNNVYDYIGYLDADLATPLQEIELFSQAFAKNNKLFAVIGTRFKRLGVKIERKLSRHLLGRIFATFASFVLNLEVYDTQCGAKIFKRNLIPNIFARPFISYWIFDVEILFRIKQSEDFKQYQDGILELPLNSWADKKGSKLKLRDFLKAPIELWHIFITYRIKQ